MRAKTGEPHQPREAGSARLGALAGQAGLPPALKLQGMIGNRAVGQLTRDRTVQAKLAVGQPGDRYEREADGLADQIFGRRQTAGEASVTLRRSPGGCDGGCGCGSSGKSPLGGLRLSQPGERSEQAADAGALAVMRARPSPGEHPRRSAAGTRGAQMPAAAPRALQNLAGRGTPLPGPQQAFFEARFGTTLDHARLHSYPEAADLAAAAGARAFTVGSHIFFGKGEYDGGSGRSIPLLAHELAHVQQDESEAVILRTPVCRNLLDVGSERSKGPLPGHLAHREITKKFIEANGPFRRLNIPAGTRAPYDTEGCNFDAAPSETDPLRYDENPRSKRGVGIPDLLLWRGGTVEIGEIKPATWGCLDFAERQVQNYVDKGNAAEDYKGRRGVDEFLVMPHSSWNLAPGRIVVGQVDLLFDWCGRGVIGYLGVDRDDADTLLCGVSDQGRIDRFVAGLLARGEQQIDEVVGAATDRRLATEIVTMNLRDALAPIIGVQAATLLAAAGARRVRAELHRLKDRIVRRVREELRRRLRGVIARIVETLCVGAAVLSARQVLAELRRQLRALAVSVTLGVAYDVVLTEAWNAVREVYQRIVEAMTSGLGRVAALIALILAALLIVVLVMDDATIVGIADDVAIAPLAAFIVWMAKVLRSGPMRLVTP
ncbi:MAG: DUF4157 domain-containing protein [Actinobacteria bacterium]|nr:DUF4157 domain-containing protein [Actinomycetota bacterium]